MDSWPYDDSNAGNHPVSASLHQGMVGAVTLVEKNGRFEWSFLRKRGQPCLQYILIAR